jgi:hypothetical protein
MAPDWTIVWEPPRIACMKVMRMAETAQAIQTRVEAFLAQEPKAELRRLHIVRGDRDIEKINCPSFVADFLRYALAQA